MEIDRETDAIRERLEAATPGPWKTYKTHANAINLMVVAARESPTSHTICEVARWPLELDEANAEFIARAPEDIERLLELVDGMRDSIARLRAVAANPPLTELCEEHVEPWQAWFDEYKRVMEATEKHTRAVDDPRHPHHPE